MRKRLPLLFVLLSLLASTLSALPLDSARFRADDGGLWHLEDNPALINPNRGKFMFGVSYDAMDSVGAALPEDELGSVGLAGLLPYLGYYRLGVIGEDYDIVLGSALSFGGSLSLGYDFQWSSTSSSFTSFGMGLLLRPTSFLSLGLTGELDDSGSREAGLGLALRPLAIGGDRDPATRAITLCADAGWGETEGIGLESLGMRLFLSDSLDLRAWYAPPSEARDWRIGLEFRLALGPAGMGVLSPSVTTSSPGWRLTEDIVMTASELKPSYDILPSSAVGRRILVIRDLDAVEPSPRGSNAFDGILPTRRTMSFPALLALLEEARYDRRIEAVAFENLPPLGGAATYQEFVHELGKLRKAGKKIYFYGDAFGRELALLAPIADGISLNPLGSVDLAGYSFHRAYYKNLFDRFGIRFVNLAPWDTKSAYNAFTESAMPPGEAEMQRRFYGDVQEQLCLALTEGRGEKLASTATEILAGGPYLQAEEALKAGIVDRIAQAGEFEDSLRSRHPGTSLVSGLGTPLGERWGDRGFMKRAAVVWLSGTIGTGRGRAGQEIGILAARELEKLRNNASIVGIVLRVDSPGGSALMSEAIAREVRLTVEAGKPVVVSMGHYAASGGYYVSAPASWIVAEPATITGSIGVTGLLPNIAEALRKLGINYDGFDLSPGSSFLDPAKDLDESELAKADAMIGSVYDRFVEVVAKGRRLESEKVKDLGEGQIWTGREALDRGLVDELGGLTEAKAWLEARVNTNLSYIDVLPGEEFHPFASLGSSLKTALGADEKGGVEALLAPVADQLMSLLNMGPGPLYYLDTEALGL